MNDLDEALKNMEYYMPKTDIPDKYMQSFKHCMYADSVFYFETIQGHSLYRGRYSLRSGKLKLYDAKSMQDDLFHLGWLMALWTVDKDGYVYGFVPPALCVKVGEKAIAESALAGFTEESNPLMIRFKFKRF